MISCTQALRSQLVTAAPAARHGSPRAWHGFPGTAAPRQPLVQLYVPRARKPPRSIPQSCLHPCACRSVSAGLFGDVSYTGPSDLQIFPEEELSGCVQCGFSSSTATHDTKAKGVSPSHPLGPLPEPLGQGRVSGRGKRKQRLAGKIVINNCKGDAWKPIHG